MNESESSFAFGLLLRGDLQENRAEITLKFGYDQMIAIKLCTIVQTIDHKAQELVAIRKYSMA